MKKTPFRLTPYQVQFLLIVGFVTVGYALYVRYLTIEFSTVALACDAGLQSMTCKMRALATYLFKHSVFGIVAVIIAVLHVMRPSIVLLTAGLVVASFLIARRFDLAPGTTRFGFYCLAAALWLSVGLRWLYRAFGFNYRLTTRRLFCFWGIFGRVPAPVLLTEIAEVRVEQSFIEGLLGVGTVRIETASRGPPTLLLGVVFHIVSGLQLELGMFPLYALCFYLPLVSWERWTRRGRDT